MGNTEGPPYDRQQSSDDPDKHRLGASVPDDMFETMRMLAQRSGDEDSDSVPHEGEAVSLAPEEQEELYSLLKSIETDPNSPDREEVRVSAKKNTPSHLRNANGLLNTRDDVAKAERQAFEKHAPTRDRPLVHYNRDGSALGAEDDRKKAYDFERYGGHLVASPGKDLETEPANVVGVAPTSEDSEGGRGRQRRKSSQFNAKNKIGSMKGATEGPTRASNNGEGEGQRSKESGNESSFVTKQNERDGAERQLLEVERTDGFDSYIDQIIDVLASYGKQEISIAGRADQSAEKKANQLKDAQGQLLAALNRMHGGDTLAEPEYESAKEKLEKKIVLPTEVSTHLGVLAERLKSEKLPEVQHNDAGPAEGDESEGGEAGSEVQPDASPRKEHPSSDTKQEAEAEGEKQSKADRQKQTQRTSKTETKVEKAKRRTVTDLLGGVTADGGENYLEALIRALDEREDGEEPFEIVSGGGRVTRQQLRDDLLQFQRQRAEGLLDGSVSAAAFTGGLNHLPLPRTIRVQIRDDVMARMPVQVPEAAKKREHEEDGGVEDGATLEGAPAPQAAAEKKTPSTRRAKVTLGHDTTEEEVAALEAAHAALGKRSEGPTPHELLDRVKQRRETEAQAEQLETEVADQEAELKDMWVRGESDPVAADEYAEKLKELNEKQGALEQARKAAGFSEKIGHGEPKPKAEEGAEGVAALKAAYEKAAEEGGIEGIKAFLQQRQKSGVDTIPSTSLTTIPIRDALEVIARLEALDPSAENYRKERSDMLVYLPGNGLRELVEKHTERDDRSRDEILQESCEELSAQYTAAALEYARARRDATQRAHEKHKRGWFGKLLEKQGFHEVAESEINSDPAVVEREQALFAIRDELHAKLDERIAHRIELRMAEQTDDFVRHKIAMRRAAGRAVRGIDVDEWKQKPMKAERAGIDGGSVPATDKQIREQYEAVTEEDIARYKEAREQKTQSMSEALKHTLRYRYLDVPLAKQHLKAEAEAFEARGEEAGVFKKAFHTAQKLWVGDRSTFKKRQLMVARNAAITTGIMVGGGALIAGGIALGAAGTALGRKLLGASIGAEAALGVSKATGKYFEGRRARTLQEKHAAAEARLKAGDRNVLFSDIFGDQEADTNAKRRHDVYRGAAATGAAVVAGGAVYGALGQGGGSAESVPSSPDRVPGTDGTNARAGDGLDRAGAEKVSEHNESDAHESADDGVRDGGAMDTAASPEGLADADGADVESDEAAESNESLESLYNPEQHYLVSGLYPDGVAPRDFLVGELTEMNTCRDLTPEQLEELASEVMQEMASSESPVPAQYASLPNGWDETPDPGTRYTLLLPRDMIEEYVRRVGVGGAGESHSLQDDVVARVMDGGPEQAETKKAPVVPEFILSPLDEGADKVGVSKEGDMHPDKPPVVEDDDHDIYGHDASLRNAPPAEPEPVHDGSPGQAPATEAAQEHTQRAELESLAHAGEAPEKMTYTSGFEKGHGVERWLQGFLGDEKNVWVREYAPDLTEEQIKKIASRIRIHLEQGTGYPGQWPTEPEEYAEQFRVQGGNWNNVPYEDSKTGEPLEVAVALPGEIVKEAIDRFYERDTVSGAGAGAVSEESSIKGGKSTAAEGAQGSGADTVETANEGGEERMSGTEQEVLPGLDTGEGAEIGAEQQMTIQEDVDALVAAHERHAEHFASLARDTPNMPQDVWDTIIGEIEAVQEAVAADDDTVLKLFEHSDPDVAQAGTKALGAVYERTALLLEELQTLRQNALKAEAGTGVGDDAPNLSEETSVHEAPGVGDAVRIGSIPNPGELGPDVPSGATGHSLRNAIVSLVEDEVFPKDWAELPKVRAYAGLIGHVTPEMWFAEDRGPTHVMSVIDDAGDRVEFTPEVQETLGALVTQMERNDMLSKLLHTKEYRDTPFVEILGMVGKEAGAPTHEGRSMVDLTNQLIESDESGVAGTVPQETGVDESREQPDSAAVEGHEERAFSQAKLKERFESVFDMPASEDAQKTIELNDIYDELTEEQRADAGERYADFLLGHQTSREDLEGLTLHSALEGADASSGAENTTALLREAVGLLRDAAAGEEGDPTAVTLVLPGDVTDETSVHEFMQRVFKAVVAKQPKN